MWSISDRSSCCLPGQFINEVFIMFDGFEKKNILTHAIYDKITDLRLCFFVNLGYLEPWLAKQIGFSISTKRKINSSLIPACLRKLCKQQNQALDNVHWSGTHRGTEYSLFIIQLQRDQVKQAMDLHLFGYMSEVC